MVLELKHAHEWTFCYVEAEAFSDQPMSLSFCHTRLIISRYHMHINLAFASFKALNAGLLISLP